jgi:hypothetical protein
MDDNIINLQQKLIEGQKLAMQGSYQRRMPAGKSITLLKECRIELRIYVENNPNLVIAYRLLSQAEEYLLNYKGAYEALNKAIELSGEKSNKDLKKIAQLKEYESAWTNISIKPEELKKLGQYLDEKLSSSDCDNSLQYTKQWLDENISKAKKTKVVKYFQNNGGFCDCEVLANIIEG